jgi:hypothetical protein
MYFHEAKDLIIGLTIKRFEFRGPDNEIFFYTDKGVIKMLCAADCCSESWIESIDAPENLIEAKILDIEEIPGGEDLPGTRQEYDQVYFLKIKTDKGYVTIDYRNSSNGEYGATLVWSFEAG